MPIRNTFITRTFEDNTITAAQVSNANITLEKLDPNVILAPFITQIVYTDGNFANVDDLASNNLGGNLKIFGDGFQPNANVYYSNISLSVNTINIANVTYISPRELRVRTTNQSIGDYNLYVINPDGSFALKVNGLKFSPFPIWITSTIPDQVSDSLISYGLSANSNITYSLYSGTLPPGLNLNPNGFITGIVTTLTDDTVYNFTVSATDSELQNVERSFSMTISVNDLLFNKTLLLLNGDSGPTVLNDASIYNSLISPAGTFRSSNKIPYSNVFTNSGSGFFAGSTDYCFAPDNNIFDLGNGDFTFETWWFPTGFGTTGQFFASQWLNNQYGWFFRADSSGSAFTGISFAYSTAGTSGTIISRTYTCTPVVNTWNHIAVVRSSGTTRAYLNGSNVGASIDNSTIFNSSQSLWLGANPDGGTNQTVKGYLSDLRLVKGVAVYTGNFPVPTAPLTNRGNAIPYSSTANVNTSFSSSATSILTFQNRVNHNNNNIIDTGANVYQIHRSGNVTAGSFSPYSSTGWSIYTPVNEVVGYGSTPVNFGTSPYTFEFWFNWDGFVQSFTYIIDSGAGYSAYGTCGGFYINNPNTNTPQLYYYVQNAQGNGQPGASWSTTTIIKPGEWYHVMVTRSGDDVKVYINGNNEGVRQGGSTWNGTIHNAHSGSVWINILSTNFFTSGYYRGYVSNWRIIKNQVLVSGNFTPAKSPLYRGNVGHTGVNVASSITGTEYLFMGGDRASYDDPVGGIITGYNNATGAKLLPFGPFSPPVKYDTSYFGSSIRHDGSGDGYETAPAHSITVGTSNFTLEGWVYFNSWQADTWWLNLPNSGGYSLILFYMAGSYSLRLYMSTDGSSWNLVNNTTIQQLYPGQWYHLAFVRNGNNFNFYVDGISRYSFSNNANFTLPIQGLKVSTQPGTPGSSTVNAFDGYSADVRFTLGDAVYTGNFTPPQRRSLLSQGSALPYTNTANINTTFPAANVLYHVKGDVAGVTDATLKNNFETFNTSTQTPVNLQFGTGSLFFNGTNDYLIAPYNPLYNLCYDEFTIEAWVNPIQTITGSPITRSLLAITTGSGNSLVFYLNGGNPMVLYQGMAQGNGTHVLATANTVQPNTWTHIAYVVSSIGYRNTVFNGYLNGANISTGVANVEVLFTNQPIYLGQAATFTPVSFNWYHGYMDDVRITKGARYRSNFTPSRARTR